MGESDTPPGGPARIFFCFARAIQDRLFEIRSEGKTSRGVFRGGVSFRTRYRDRPRLYLNPAILMCIEDSRSNILRGPVKSVIQTPPRELNAKSWDWTATHVKSVNDKIIGSKFSEESMYSERFGTSVRNWVRPQEEGCMHRWKTKLRKIQQVSDNIQLVYRDRNLAVSKIDPP